MKKKRSRARSACPLQEGLIADMDATTRPEGEQSDHCVEAGMQQQAVGKL